jgi:lipopolysaccharide transport system ATP-binding protein
MLTGSFDRPRKSSLKDRQIWAVRDVSFEIQRGEFVGVIGTRGCGKSTLVKLLIGVTSPTSGRVIVNGRLGVFRGYGRDLHPDLTLRENMLLTGAALRMSKAEVLQRLDELAASAKLKPADADVEVEQLSQKKRMRLAFSIAAHLDTDILVVDELTADEGFRRRSLETMDRLNRQGRTLVFISHHLGDMLNRCTRTIWLHEGRVAGIGQTREIVERYRSMLASAPRPPSEVIA